jgi:hypothetical protein
MQSHDNRTTASNPDGLIQITLQNWTAAIDKQIDALVCDWNTGEDTIFVPHSGQIHLKELDIRNILLCREFSRQFQVAGTTLDADDGATPRRKSEGEFAMSAAEIEHIAVRAEELVDQGYERIFTVASRN